MRGLSEQKVINCWPKLGPPEGVSPAGFILRIFSRSLNKWTQLFSHFPYLGLGRRAVSAKKVQD